MLNFERICACKYYGIASDFSLAIFLNNIGGQCY